MIAIHLIAIPFGSSYGQTPPAFDLPRQSSPDTPPQDAEKRLLEIEATIQKRKQEREQALLEAAASPASSRDGRLEPISPQVQQRSEGNTDGLPMPSVREVPTPLSDAQAMGDWLLLADVVASTYRAYPEIEIARLQAGVTRGEVTTSLGAYDVKLEYFSLNQPIGYYENSRNGIAVNRQLWWGGFATAGYRIGRGAFEPWYLERETNKGGAFTAGWVQPLLQGRAIDPYRVALFQSNLNRQAVQPEIQHNILWASLEAAYSYWKWVEAGNVLQSQERLLDLANQRNTILVKLFERGLSTRQELSINAQAISERQLKVYESQQKFRDAAFRLAIFLRDDSGNPMLAAPEWLPADFPSVDRMPDFDFQSDFIAAQQRRPELQLIAIDIQKLQWDLQLARNQTLPTVDAEIRGWQNMGDPAKSLDDKSDFVLESGLVGGVPIQRRKARGKIDSTLAKIQQTEQKRFLQINKIEVELRTAANDLENAKRMVDRSAQLVRETRETLDYFRRDFAAGNRDFLFLLQQEAKVTESEIKLLDAERDFFMALARLQAALGLDPLEQSLNIDQRASSAPAP